MKLIRVEPDNQRHLRFMYMMLSERSSDVTISFEMPTWYEHKEFVKNNPYQAWYLIEVDDKFIGNIYLNQDDSWGYFIKREYQGKGYGTKALQRLVMCHPKEYYYANINPKNETAIHQARDKFKGKLIQITYKVRGDDILNLE